MTTNGIYSTLPKWQLAIVFGAPVVLGLGYIYYKSSGSINSTKICKDNKVKNKKSILINSETYTSTDEDLKNKDPAHVKEILLKKAQQFKTEGNKFFNVGKFDEAITQYNLAIKACPQDNFEELATYYQNRAAAHEKLQKFNAVKADCSRALELQPKYIKALIRRARALEFNDELEMGLEDITAACILERFSNPQTLYTADNILKKLGKQHAQDYMLTKKPVMPSKHFIQTYFAAFQNDPVFTNINKIIIDESKTIFDSIIKSLQDQEYDKIISLCTEELNYHPASIEIRIKTLLIRGTFYLLLGEHDNALKDLNTVINDINIPVKYKVNAFIKRASMYIQLENAEKTFADFDEAIKLDPKCGDIYHNRGQVNLLLDNISSAKTDFEMAVELNPNFGVAFVQKCYTDYRYAVSKKDFNLMSLSMQYFNDAFIRFPDCSECYTLYAQILADTQEYEKADYYFSKALKIDPNNATILVHKGLLKLQWQNDVEKAVELIKQAILIDEKCELGYETLGTIEVQRGNLEEAIKWFEKALSLGRTVTELTHIFSLKDAAKAQLIISNRLGEDLLKSVQQELSFC